MAMPTPTTISTATAEIHVTTNDEAKAAFAVLSGYDIGETYLSNLPESWSAASTSTRVTVSRGGVTHTASAKRWHVATRTGAPSGSPCRYYLGKMLGQGS